MERGEFSFFKDLKNFLHMWKLFRTEKPDLVHLVTIKPYLYGGILSRLTGVPSVISAVSGLGTLFLHKDLKSKFFRFLLIPIYYFAFNHPNQKVIVQNKDDAEVISNLCVKNSLKIKLINGSGVKLENFNNPSEPTGIPVVCFAARLLRDKGVFEFVSAAKIIKNKGIKARFLLAGDLDLRNPSGLSKNDLKKLKEESYIEVIGFKQNIPELYANSNIICLPSYREGLPKSLIEAAAASRAVVTTDVPGCRDAIIPNKTGLLVPVKDPEKLAEALQWLLEHPSERIKMGRAGRKLAEKEFPIEKVVQLHLDIYKELIDKKN